MTSAQYPIGKFSYVDLNSESKQQELIESIAELPTKFNKAVYGLNDTQLNTPYRDGGWTVRQVAHHIPDSHMNAYIRFKLGLTEECPTIKPYDENKWSDLAEVQITPIAVSIELTESIHVRWVNLLRSLKPQDFERQINHPESGVMTLDRMLALYEWHGSHHVAQIESLRQRMNW